MIKPITNLSILLFCICSFTFAQDWTLVWSDEFDYTGVPDSTKWSFDVEGNAWDWGNKELQNYTPAEKRNAWVEQGHLIIEARKEKWSYPGDGQERNFTSARLRTIHKGDWRYCKVEVKAKLPGGRGTWPAIWMLPTDNAYGIWPKSGELDIMEHVGYDPGRVHFCVHTEAYNHMHGTQQGANKVLNNPLQNFFIYSMEWQEDRAEFYANSEKIFTFANAGAGYTKWPFDKRFHLLLNIAVGGSWGGQQGVDTTIFPVRMHIDYVRVYQKNVPIQENHLKNENNNYNVNIICTPHKRSVSLSFFIPRADAVSATLYTITGKKISQKATSFSKAGQHSLVLSKGSQSMSTGIYALLFQVGNEAIMRRFYLK